MIDYLLDRVNCLLDRQPAHLVTLSSVGFFVFGLWVIGYQLGVL